MASVSGFRASSISNFSFISCLDDFSEDGDGAPADSVLDVAEGQSAEGTEQVGVPEIESLDHILRLPPTPKRMGKRSVKRTHPVADGNIDGMREAAEVKKQKLEELKHRQEDRQQKKKENNLQQLEKVKLRYKKDEKLINELSKLKSNKTNIKKLESAKNRNNKDKTLIITLTKLCDEAVDDE